MQTIEKPSLLKLEGVKKYFPIKGGLLQRVQGNVKAVENVSLEVFEGESVGVVGESGCGKSTLGRTILGLEEITDGKVYFQSQDTQALSSKERKAIKKDMQMIFQDPYASLNPRQKIGNALEEAFVIHTNLSKEDRKQRVVELLQEVGLKEEHYDRYPHEFSGGQRQRIGIARAIALNPSLIICDEAVSALDVSVQAQVLKLMKGLKDKYQLTYLFISHDLGVVRYFCDRVLVMYLGNTVELASSEKLYENPLHPYTKGLIKSIPQMEGDRSQKLHVIEGTVPSLDSIPIGCRFAPRCPFADSVCLEKAPDLTETSSNQKVRCWHFEKIAQEEECYANVSS